MHILVKVISVYVRETLIRSVFMYFHICLTHLSHITKNNVIFIRSIIVFDFWFYYTLKQHLTHQSLCPSGFTKLTKYPV